MVEAMTKRLILLFVTLVLALGAGCSSDPDTSLGSVFLDDGLIDSDPGKAYQDTIRITSGDVSYVTNSTITKAATMNIGRKNNIESAMMLRFDFSNPGNDTLRTVNRAVLTLRVTTSAQTDSLNARFYEFLSPFSENDTLSSLDISATAIPDSSGVSTDRIMRFFPSTYTLPTALVQDWIRGNLDHNGIAMVLNDTTTTKELLYGTRTNTSSLRPFLSVYFTDLTISSYNVRDDGTFLQDLAPPTTDLTLSDGPTRRIYVPVDLSSLPDSLLLHDARLVLRVVPNTWTGGDNAVQIYVPDSDVAGDPDNLTGGFVIGALLDPDAGQLELPVRSRIQTFLNDPAENRGFVLRFSLEGSAIRSILFYGTANPDNLKPFLDVTYSDPATFPEN